MPLPGYVPGQKWLAEHIVTCEELFRVTRDPLTPGLVASNSLSSTDFVENVWKMLHLFQLTMYMYDEKHLNLTLSNN